MDQALRDTLAALAEAMKAAGNDLDLRRKLLLAARDLIELRTMLQENGRGAA